jgi:hypothetical protein
MTTIDALRVTAARVFTIRGDRDLVLRLTTADGDQNYLFHADDFAAFAKRMAADAALLCASEKEGGGHG